MANRLDHYPLYLIAAEIKDQKIVPGTVHPLCCRNISVKSMTVNGQDSQNKDYSQSVESYSFCKTDEYGRFCILDEKGEKAATFIRCIEKTRKSVQLLPQPAVEASIYLIKDGTANGTWKDRLKQLVQNELIPDEESLFDTFIFTKNDLSKDFLKNLSETEIKGLDSHFSDGQRYLGLTIPIVRHLIIILPNDIKEILLSNTYCIINKDIIKYKELPFNLPGSEEETDQIRFRCAVISRPTEELPSGIYTLTGIGKSPSYIDPASEQKTNQYTLSFKADFTMSTPIGPMDIINGYPITLEEVMLMHYPAEYEHLVSALNSFVKYDNSGNKEPFIKATNILKQTFDVAKVIKEKHDFVKDRIEYDKKKFLDDALNVIGQECPEVRNAYKLATSYIKAKGKIDTIFKTWKINEQLFTIIEASSGISTIKKAYFCALGAKVYNTYGEDILKHILSSKVVGKKYALKILSSKNESAKLDFLLKTDGPHLKILEKQQSLYGKALTGIDLAFSAYDTFQAFSSVWELSQNAAEEQKKYGRIINAATSLNLKAGSRDTTATVIKARIGVDKMAQGLDQAQIQAFWSAFNLLCSIGSLTPAAPAITIVRFIIETGKACQLAMTTARDQFEQTFPNSCITQFFKQMRIVHRLNTDMRTNYELLTNTRILASYTDTKAQDMYIQSRIYAEAIRGFMALIQRISCRIYKNVSGNGIDYNEFDRKVAEYNIEGYYKRFICKNGWLVPQRALPIGLDVIWSYMKWEESANAYTYACTSGSPQTGTSHRFYGTTVQGATPPNHWKADFHKHFPIHTMSSSDCRTLAHIFSQNYTGAQEFIRYTQLYYRQEPENDTTTINTGWKPIWSIANNPDAITTKTQLRIIIAFDGGVDLRAVPMSIKLNRVETFMDIGGPEYKFIPVPLEVQEGGLIPGEEHLKGKLGIVFFPFYMFGGEIRYGIRPLECSDSVLGIITQAIWKGKVDTPNQYAFSIKVGDCCVPLFFNPTFADYSKVSSLLLNFAKSSNKVFIPALGRHTVLFKLDRKNSIDKNMLQCSSFLKSRTIEEETPSLKGPYARAGVSGVFFHNGKTGEYFPMAKWVTNNGVSLPQKIRGQIELPKTYCKRDFVRVSVIIYITVVNDTQFVRNKSYLHSWTATPCGLIVKEKSLLSSSNKQTIPGTLHFLGYATKVKNEGHIGFNYLKIRTSVDTKAVDVVFNKDTIDTVPETPALTEELGALLSWGKPGNFNRYLFADPGIGDFSGSAFFAADFSLFWDDNGERKMGLHKDLAPKDTVEIILNGAGKLVLNVDRDIKIPDL